MAQAAVKNPSLPGLGGNRDRCTSHTSGVRPRKNESRRRKWVSQCLQSWKNCVGCTFGETIDPCERVQQRTVEHLPVSQETVEAVTALPFERVQQRTTEHIEQKVDFSFSGKVCGRVALDSTRTLAADQRAKFHKLLRTLSNSSTSCHKSNFRKGSVNRS